MIYLLQINGGCYKFTSHIPQTETNLGAMFLGSDWKRLTLLVKQAKKSNLYCDESDDGIDEIAQDAHKMEIDLMNRRRKVLRNQEGQIITSYKIYESLNDMVERKTCA